MRNKLLPIILLVATGVLALVSLLLLPETVVTQFSVGSSDVSTMPKLLAVLLPTALAGGGAAASLLDRGGSAKPLVVSAVGILVFVIMLAVNL